MVFSIEGEFNYRRRIRTHKGSNPQQIGMRKKPTSYASITAAKF